MPLVHGADLVEVSRRRISGEHRVTLLGTVIFCGRLRLDIGIGDDRFGQLIQRSFSEILFESADFQIKVHGDIHDFGSSDPEPTSAVSAKQPSRMDVAIAASLSMFVAMYQSPPV